MKEGRKRNQRSLGDWVLIGILVLFDIGLVFLARNYFHALNEITAQALLNRPKEAEILGVQELVQLARRGSWENFEKARNEEVAYYLQAKLNPSPGNALYFFPETLPPQSLEKEFAMNELRPSLTALKDAYLKRKEKDARKAFKLLESRVQNYELGASTEPTDLSQEAKTFLKLYHEFTSFNLRNPSSR